MEIIFDGVISGTSEAVFNVGVKSQFNVFFGNRFYGVEQRIYLIEGIDSLLELFKADRDVVTELKKAKAALTALAK